MNSSYLGECHIRVNIDKNNLDSYISLRTMLLERYKGKKVLVYPGHVTSAADQAYSHGCALDVSEWADFSLKSYRAAGNHRSVDIFPGRNIHSLCVATSRTGYVVGPKGELYKCWEDVGKQEMVIGDLSAEKTITNPELIAQYYTGTDPYNDPECLSCDVLPICGGGCVNRRMRARHYGEVGLEYCSPYRDNLVSYLEAYIDSYKSKEICNNLLSPGPAKGFTEGYRVISPVPKAANGNTGVPTQRIPQEG
jgi:uncharacterized protein